MTTLSDTISSVPTTNKILHGSVFLITRDGTVLAAQQTTPLLKIGDCLYRSLGVAEEEWQQLVSMKRALLPDSFLFMAGNRPLIAWCAFLARTDLLAIFAPEGEMRTLLSAPAAFADALSGYHILLSRGALARYLPADGALPPSACEWLAALQAPLFEHSLLEAPIYAADGTQQIRPRALVDLLGARAAAMASLLGVTLHADWQGIGAANLPFPDLEWVTACLAALFLTAREISPRSEVFLTLSREGPDGPVLEARFTRTSTADGMGALAYLAADALSRNELFERSVAPDDATKAFLRFSICRKELACLSLKGTPQLG